MLAGVTLVSSGRVKMACVWKGFASMFMLKAINQGKVFSIRPALQSSKIQKLMQVNVKENKYSKII
jgi:hypothetical protein